MEQPKEQNVQNEKFFPACAAPVYHYEEDEIDLYELWLTLKRRKKVVFVITFIAVLIAFFLAFFYLKPMYKTETTLMPLGGKSKGGLSSLLSSLPINIPIPAATSTSGITVEAVLKSRTLRERIVKRLNLIEVLGKGSENYTLMDAVNALENFINTSTDRKTGVITLTVEFWDPDMAYKIAKVALDEADKILNEKSFTLARKYRIYVGERLKEARERIKLLEKIYVEFSEGKLKEIPFLSSDESYAYGKLKGELIAQKERLKAMVEGAGFSEEDIEAQKRKVQELEKKIASFSKRFSAEFISAPKLQFNIMKLTAEMEIAKGIYETLVKEYELAKAQEMKEQISFQVIDPPYRPDPKKPYKPKKKLIMAVALVSGLFLGIFMAFFKEWLDNVKARNEKTNQTSL